jgi:hypothetical protein
MALLQRLSWLSVLPRAHTTHYHGVLASAHPWRALVVPKEETLKKPPLRGCGSRWIKWSDLLRRVFLAEALLCQVCGGERRVIAQIEEGPVARKILAHLGLPTTLPARTPARAQAQVEIWNTGPPGAELRAPRGRRRGGFLRRDAWPLTAARSPSGQS